MRARLYAATAITSSISRPKSSTSNGARKSRSPTVGSQSASSRQTRGSRFADAETLTDEQFSVAIANGGRFVIYAYCISLVFVSFRQSSAVHLLRPHETGVWKGIPYTLLSLVAGWWGLPFGPIFTVMSIYRNSVGGLDVTDEVLGSLDLLTRRA